MKDADKPEKRQSLAMWVQALVASLCAAPVYFDPHAPDNRLAHLLLVILAGAVGAYAVTFLWVWIRYGWRAARSIGFSDPEARRAREITRYLRHPPPGA